jgi:hypothetical protein
MVGWLVSWFAGWLTNQQTNQLTVINPKNPIEPIILAAS